MKKILLILLSILVLFFVLIAINPPEIVFEDRKIVYPEKPESIPNNVFWAGGIDGGNFIYVEPYKDTGTLYYVQIYNDFTGDIEYKGLLKYSGRGSLKQPLNDAALYQGWDGTKLHLVSGESMTIYDNQSSNGS
ncbi:hypothetical protein SG34_009905 [Thalassomonas viridans]|uniref:Uncharacterized protein n=1 Tax=Thalassomonas viridans TaxID=137584 RepID=A0AAF0CBH0_9GAMM|nr:hypothetical protein [Thalassomonas viridans]WDE07170.1 hypothetical protein SG34_009905 [Thalassomonas viridans]